MPDGTDLGQELAKARDWASLIEAGCGALIGTATVLLGVRGWWRRRRRRQAETRAAAAKATRDAEDARIALLIAAALKKFRETEMESDMSATLEAVRAILSAHAAEADGQVKAIGATVGSMAATVERACQRMDDRVETCHERIDDFLRSIATGQMPHFRALPRPSTIEG